MNNKEVHYEGWLIKSPPTKRIWRAQRWRRRWFTLKQGEIPEQFCLEYYTDRNCRKLKGVIDLDQCEQVDCGLRLENRKQKFQFMFDIKTPKRTYYLAADTEADMRDWVNCICQVCHLHDTKQSNELQDENCTQQSSSATLTNSTLNTTTTSLHSSAGDTSSASTFGANGSRLDFLRRTAGPTGNVIEQQPTLTQAAEMASTAAIASGTNINHSDSVYVNTEYTNRDTMLCDAHFDQQHLLSAVQQQPPPSPATALYLNHSALLQAQAMENARLAVNSNGVVRKIPENLVLNNQTLADAVQSQSVQASPALSTASGPYIPISECFSGSPKFLPEGGGANPTTPLNNLDPKFYDTPRSHNNIGLNLTNDQSYSPKITNCSLQQLSASAAVGVKNRSQRSDSDSESVFTDDDEWTHPMPLRENVDRSTRPSDSSIENESFVLTYSQRFSKLPEEVGSKLSQTPADGNSTMAAAPLGLAAPPPHSGHTLEKLAKVLKNKNNLILDFKDNEKLQRELPQLSDTENTSPAIGPRNADSVVDESYDIPRSHQLPYYNIGQLLEKVSSPHTANPIAASTPNLMAGLQDAAITGTTINTMAVAVTSSAHSVAATPMSACTLPRPHCYTNAAPSKVIEGNVFRYDFMEPSECPPVNRKLKPKTVQLDEKTKVVSSEDKPPEEFPAKPPIVESLANKLCSASLQSSLPPSVDRKCKPNAYKLGSSATMSPGGRRTTGAPLSMVLPHESEGAIGGSFHMETRTLPRQPRPNYATGNPNSPSLAAQHQRTASAVAAMQQAPVAMQAATAQTQAQTQGQVQVPLPPKQNEHALQYFDLDVSNKPPLNRQSMSVGNLNASGGVLRLLGGLSTDPMPRAPQASGVVYNFVDFVKTEAFKRIREERNKESECGVNSANANK